MIKIAPLTKESFVPFGEVIETDHSDHFTINKGSTERYHALATLELSEPDDQGIINIFRAQKLVYPLRIELLERHPKGSQAFIPLDRQAFLIVVAPAGDQPEINEIRCFLSNGKQGINYARGVWHHPILSLENNSDFLVVDRSGQGNNCDEHYFKPEEQLELDITTLER